MEIDKKLVEEGQQFLKLSEKFKRSINPNSGEPGWLISSAWLNRYKKSIYYEALHMDLTPEPEEYQHPGKIINSDFLDTDSHVFLLGSGVEPSKGCEPEMIDRFIRDDALENQHFEVINGEIWDFLKEKY